MSYTRLRFKVNAKKHKKTTSHKFIRFQNRVRERHDPDFVQFISFSNLFLLLITRYNGYKQRLMSFEHTKF